MDGVIRATQHFLPLLKKGRNARIINVSSSWGSLNSLSQCPTEVPSYHISKAALNMWTVILASELRSDGISVNSVCPGWVQTDMGTKAAFKTVEQGAQIILKLATDLSPPTGGFYNDDGVVQW